ncbi:MULTISPECIES: hypothetical protein [unclassified Streptomyces]|uniref:hypothetical protein n=1 Tax=unclassified Streptomyces TaxID=2593676 RepID=UPI00386390CD
MCFAAPLLGPSAWIVDPDLLGVSDPDQQFVVRTAEPGTPSHDGLRIPASWAAGTARSASGAAGSG